MTEHQELPLYQCHKKVRALQIREIHRAPNGEPGAYIYPAEPGYAPFHVTEEWLKRHLPSAGGYFVLYEDGYKSYSPRLPFEQGYTLLDEPAQD